MSLLKFKCQECGESVLRRCVKDIFNVKKIRIIICKKCGCEYEIQNKYHWVVTFLLNVVFITLSVCLFVADIVVTAIGAFFSSL